MIVVTGGAGFIGSAFVAHLNTLGVTDILIVDELGTSEKWRNLVSLRFRDVVHKDEFRRRLLEGRTFEPIEAIVHMGACSSTTETNADYLLENNYRYTRDLADWAVLRNIRFVYASSAATYGDGSAGYDDEISLDRLVPLNIYGYSKQLFDLWAWRTGALQRICGVKFFNVYGPNEYHKDDMRSVVHKAWDQVRTTGQVRLFKSHRPDYGDGEQKRDFIWIGDCVRVLAWLLEHRNVNGIFNLGTGRARTWKDLVHAVFAAMGREPRIEFIDIPEPIRNKYQYFTEARMEKLRAAGCPFEPTPLEEGVRQYVAILARPHPYLP